MQRSGNMKPSSGNVNNDAVVHKNLHCMYNEHALTNYNIFMYICWNFFSLQFYKPLKQKVIDILNEKRIDGGDSSCFTTVLPMNM